MTLLELFIFYALALSITLAVAGLRSRATESKAVTRELRPLRLLIVGATGGTGRQLVSLALQQGHQVTALVRKPEKLTEDHPRLTVTRGDVLDYPTIDAAMQGQDAVLSALGHKRFFYPNRILSTGTDNLLRAMSAHGVRRLVCETALGLGNSSGRMGLYYTFFVVPVILPFYFWDKTRQERIISQSDVEWVIVRPGVLTNKKPRGAYRHGLNVGSFLWTVRISRADVADFMLNQLNDDTYVGMATGVCW